MLFSILIGSIAWIDQIQRHKRIYSYATDSNEESSQISSALYLPPPLPFLEPQSIVGRREVFVLPRDEVSLQKFQIAITLPSKYKPIPMDVNELCFSPNESADGMVCIALACQGKCQQIKEEISHAMLRDLEKFFIQNRLVRVLHAHVHNPRFVEYSFWYEDDLGV